MIHVVVAGLPLAAGLAAALLAERRGWAPPLWVALAVGAALRLLLLVLAAADSWQPYDLDQDFRATADAVRGGHDPLVYVRPGGWHFLPFMAYLLAGQRELGLLLGVPWSVAARIVPVLADIALIPLVGRLAGDRRELRSFQYACAPLGVMVAAIHGQFPPLILLLGVGALLAARDGRRHLAGPLIGLAVTSGSWAVLLLPGVLLTLRDARARLVTLAWTAVVPIAFLLSSAVFLGTPAGRLFATATGAASARAVTGDWGWSALLTGGEEVVSPHIARIGTPVLAAGLLLAAWLWRRADPVGLTVALLLVFIVVTYRLGTQYLLWPLPYLVARPTRGAWAAIAAGSAWAATGYLYLSRLSVHGWQDAHRWWAPASLVVIALLVRALPPRRAAGDAGRSAAPGGQADPRPHVIG